MLLFLKILSGMVNSVNSDQTAPSGSALFSHIFLVETGVQNSKTFTILYFEKGIYTLMRQDA